MNDNYQPREKAYKRFLNYKNTSGIRAGPGGHDQTLAVKNNNFNLKENNLLVLQCKTNKLFPLAITIIKIAKSIIPRSNNFSLFKGRIVTFGFLNKQIFVAGNLSFCSFVHEKPQ